MYPQVNKEATGTKEIFYRLVKEKRIMIPVVILAVACIWFPVVFMIAFTLSHQQGFLTMVVAPILLFLGPLSMGFLLLYSMYREAVRESFWKQLGLKYTWEYSPIRDISNEKALLFNTGQSKSTHYGIAGKYNNQPFSIFEYQYVTGRGKHKRRHSLTVYEVKFTGTFPHIYLNYKNDGYSNPPSLLSTHTLIPLPAEFEDKFKLYAPQKYEIETLEIFTPDILRLLLDSSWDHDMEFVDGELVIYRKVQFSNVQQFDSEFTKIKKFVDILSPLLNRLNLTQVGDALPILKKPLF